MRRAASWTHPLQEILFPVGVLVLLKSNFSFANSIIAFFLSSLFFLLPFGKAGMGFIFPWAMPATALAAIAPFQMVFLREDNIAFRREVIFIGFELVQPAHCWFEV